MSNIINHIQVIAPAKLNLNLHILGLNENNYHLLEGVSVFTHDGDILDIQINLNLEQDILEINGLFGHYLHCENRNNNLIMRAVKYLRNYCDVPKLFITLEKNIPIQAGYGGGSSNAAALLKAVNQLCHLNLSADIMHKIALQLGADVPMCLYAKPCFVQNIGDVITSIHSTNQHYYCLLLKPSVMLATPKVFQMLKQKNNQKMPHNIDNYINYALYKGRNDLWQPACDIAPILHQYLAHLQTTNPIKAAMSGSGSGLFGLYHTLQEMDNAYEFLKKIYNNDFIMRTSVTL
jgi:4-diphosphocytidyl-2-C-methyl-D-erythritol kinase